jgi:hypothetical protein
MRNYFSFAFKLCIFWLCTFAPFSADAIVFSSIIALYKILMGEAGAWAVSVKQTAVSANQIVQVTHQSNKTLTEAISVINQQQRIVKATVDYNSLTGQPLSTQCVGMLGTKAIIDKKQIIDKTNLQQSIEFSSKVTQSGSENFINKMAKMQAKYCSELEKQTGICDKVSEKSNLDSNFAHNFTKSDLTKEEAVVAQDYISNVITPKIDINSQCTSSNCHSSASSELQYNAVLSMASFSLNNQINQRRIQAEN